MTAGPIDITPEIRKLCRILGLDADYVAKIELTPGRAKVTLFNGKQGRFKGAKYVNPDTGEAAVETLEYVTVP